MGTSTSKFSFKFIFSCLSHCSTLTETISYSYCAYGFGKTKIFGTSHALLSGATSRQWEGGGSAARLFIWKGNITGSNYWYSGYTKQPCYLRFDSYLEGFLRGPGWWCQWVAPGGCMWWWWRACWGWCCYLSCRVRCKVSCCNTEHTAPGQRTDNWGSPVEKDRCRKMALTFLIKMRHVEKNWEIKKDVYTVVQEGRFRSWRCRQREIKDSRVKQEKQNIWWSNVRFALHQCCYFTVQIPKHKCKHMSVLSYIWTLFCLVFSPLPFLCGIMHLCWRKYSR